MALNEELIAIEASHNLYIQRLAVQYGNEAVPFIDAMKEDISTRINKEVGKNLTPLRREKLLKDIDAIVKESLNSYIVTLMANNSDLGIYEAAYQAKTLAELYPAITETAAVTKSVINTTAKNSLISIGEGTYTSYNQMLSNFVNSNAEQIDNIVANGFVSGMTTRDIAAQVMSEVDNRVAKTRKQALGVARTGTNHYANQARKAYFDEDPVIIGTRRLATLDSSTSDYCRSIDNTVVMIDDPKYKNAFSPFHYNCRTVNTPEVDSKYDYDDSAERRPENFRNAETGLLDPKQTSSKKIYYESMKSLDAKSQDAILGVTLGKAFREGLRSGKLTPESFARLTIDKGMQRGLTLKEMIQKDNALSRILIAQNKGKNNYVGWLLDK